MKLNKKQLETKAKIEEFASLFGIPSDWATAIALSESSLGSVQESPTGCKGVFQMSTIAMKDLWLEMSKNDEELIDIACGCAFLYLLLRRHKSIEEATLRYCDPNDRHFYLGRVLTYMEALKNV